MAVSFQKAAKPPSSSSSTSIPNLATAITTTLLKTLNPQIPDTSNFNTPSNFPPLQPFSRHLTTPLVTRVINNLHNHPKHALLFFNWSSHHFSHPPSSFLAITNLLLSHSLFSTAFSLLRLHNNLSDSLLCRFIAAFGHRGDIRAAVHCFHKANIFSGGRCLFSLNALLGVLVRANRVNLASAVYDRVVVAEGVVRPDVFTYTAMIRGFCKMGMIDDARKVFDEMRCEPNVVTYNTMIHGLCKKGDMEGAKKVFNRLAETQSCKPDVVTFTTLIDGYSKRGEFGEALECMKEMRERGCVPNVLTYNSLIEGLCLNGNVDEAKRVMTRMRLNGVKDNVTTNTSLLKGFCIVGKSDEAIKHFKEMVSRGMNPDVKAYDVIVNEYCKIRRANDAVLLIREMVARGIKPNVSSFNAVFRALIALGKLEGAVLLLKQMPQMGCSPNFLSYSTVVCGLCKVNGRMQQVEELVWDMLQNGHNLDSTMYNYLVLGYCGDGDEEMAMKMVYDIIDNSFVINKDTFCILLKELCGKGKVKEAERVVEEICRRCHVPDDINAYRFLLYQLSEKAEAT